jgi:hypothetical protein
MEQSRYWEADSSSASQEIPLILYNPQVNFCVLKRPPPFSVLSRSNTIDSLILFQIRFKIILLPTRRFSEWFLSALSPNQNPPCTYLPHMRHIRRPSHFSRFSTLNIFGDEYRSWSPYNAFSPLQTFLPRTPKFLPHPPILRCPQSL